MAIQEAKEQIGKLFDTGYKTLTKKKFFIDNPDDLENLPDENECLAGSIAVDTSSGDAYMMNTDGEWNKIFSEGGNNEGDEGSSSSGVNFEIIKIATVSISGKSDNAYVISTGGVFQGDGNTQPTALGEIIGDKHIVNLICNIAVTPKVTIGSSKKDVILYQDDEEVKAASMFSVRFLAFDSSSWQGTSTNLYAVCI